MIRFQFVDDARNDHSVERLYEVLKLNRSSYYKWKKNSSTRKKRLLSDSIVGARIKTIFTHERGCYGAKRITAQLNDDSGAAPVTHKKFARIMRALKLFGYAEKRKVTTTGSDQKKPVFPDLGGRKFTAARPNQVNVGDIAHLRSRMGQICTWPRSSIASHGGWWALRLPIIYVRRWYKMPW